MPESAAALRVIRAGHEMADLDALTLVVSRVKEYDPRVAFKRGKR